LNAPGNEHLSHASGNWIFGNQQYFKQTTGLIFMKKQVLLATAFASLMALSAQSVLAQNVAIVNGKAVPKTRLDILAQQVAKGGKPITADMQAQLREEVIAREVFMQEAEKQGLSTTDEFKAQMELARQTIMIRALFADYQKKNPVTDADLKAEYDKFAAANGGKEYKARHILVETEAEAKAIIASLKKTGKFEDIAKKQSKDAGSGANGGDLDWANPSSYVPEFSAALLKLNKGQLTDVPVKTQFGYHVIRVDDVRNAQLPEFEQLKPQIAQQMEQQKLAAFQQGLREKAKIE
jgi:peptidyl-prolyl cis-trans isomerase C